MLESDATAPCSIMGCRKSGKQLRRYMALAQFCCTRVDDEEESDTRARMPSSLMSTSAFSGFCAQLRIVIASRLATLMSLESLGSSYVLDETLWSSSSSSLPLLAYSTPDALRRWNGVAFSRSSSRLLLLGLTAMLCWRGFGLSLSFFEAKLGAPSGMLPCSSRDCSRMSEDRRIRLLLKMGFMRTFLPILRASFLVWNAAKTVVSRLGNIPMLCSGVTSWLFGTPPSVLGRALSAFISRSILSMVAAGGWRGLRPRCDECF
mmetsp:Transcript_3223/g.9324  ORF Transcript_3223/g.9324 Transcript_3223/m.9324 type:complete len:262 (-) Transcript_3223:477-1262(-)